MKNKKNLLKENEKLDDLKIDNLFVIQNTKKYCFSSDSVLLSNFAEVGHRDIVAEFCSGSGVVSFLINAKYSPKSIIGFELDNSFYEMSCRSLIFNNISNIKFVNCDVGDVIKLIGKNLFDVVVCNPPYYPISKAKNINEKYKTTKYEFSLTLEQMFLSASQVLKFSGKFFLIHLSERIEEILSTANKFNLSCKKLQFVFSKNKKSHLVLLKFVKGGKQGAEVIPPIFLK